MNLRVAGLALACVLLVSGCGSMSRSEYVDAVERSCASAAKDQQRILSEAEDANRSLSDAYPDLRASARRYAEKVKDLHPPDDLSEANDALVDQLATSDPNVVGAMAARRLVRAYEAVGATTCARRVESQLQDAEKQPGLG